jgi:hypothetical protein
MKIEIVNSLSEEICLIAEEICLIAEENCLIAEEKRVFAEENCLENRGLNKVLQIIDQFKGYPYTLTNVFFLSLSEIIQVLLLKSN